MMAVEIASYGLAVGEVAQVDDEVTDVAHLCFSVSKQCTDIVQQSRGLSLHVAGVEHLPLVVDAGRSRDIVNLAVGQCQSGGRC